MEEKGAGTDLERKVQRRRLGVLTVCGGCSPTSSDAHRLSGWQQGDGAWGRVTETSVL